MVKSKNEIKYDSTEITIEEIAKNYELNSDFVLKELKKIGIRKKATTEVIEEASVEKVFAHFDSIKTGDKNKQEKRGDKKVSESKEISLTPPITPKTLADAIDKKPTEIVMALMQMNILASMNQVVDQTVAKTICRKYGYDLITEKQQEKAQEKGEQKQEEARVEAENLIDAQEDLQKRPPIVTFMGHVDHGKTSIQDAIRKTNVVKGEAGGITQHTGASVVKHNGETIVFIDTPGHEAFTAMRSRGANATDIVVLVVAADDGFMPQTVEALSHAKAANVPIIVAINKIDLPDADPAKILLQMQQNNLMSEEWGGEVGVVKVSAITGEGLDGLLDRILLEAEILELKANPKRPAEGIVLEAALEQGLGAVANVLVTKGTLHTGDIILCDQYYGKVKLLIDSEGKRVNSITSGLPAKIVGFSGVPMAGGLFSTYKNEKIAAAIADKKTVEVRNKGLARPTTTTLENLFSNIKDNLRNDLNLIVKTDVQGTAEAIKDSLFKLPSEKIKVNIVHSAVGAISESDILLASASKAIVVGFHVKVNPGVNDLAKKENTEIRLYSIIYELIEDIKDALEGRLAPDQREIRLGKAKILKIFEVSKGPNVCGCIVDEGIIKVGAKSRVFRNKELIFNGVVRSLRRFQSDVKEVKSGQECGIRLDNFLDFQENDLIELYEVEFKKASL